MRSFTLPFWTILNLVPGSNAAETIWNSRNVAHVCEMTETHKQQSMWLGLRSRKQKELFQLAMSKSCWLRLVKERPGSWHSKSVTLSAFQPSYYSAHSAIDLAFRVLWVLWPFCQLLPTQLPFNGPMCYLVLSIVSLQPFEMSLEQLSLDRDIPFVNYTPDLAMAKNNSSWMRRFGKTVAKAKTHRQWKWVGQPGKFGPKSGCNSDPTNIPIKIFQARPASCEWAAIIKRKDEKM